MSSNRGSGFLTGFVIGGVVGAALALLLAPRPGEETRKQLLERAGGLGEGSEDVSTLVRTAADQLLETGKTVIDSQRTRAQKAWHEGKEAAQQTTTEMLSKLTHSQSGSNL